MIPVSAHIHAHAVFFYWFTRKSRHDHKFKIKFQTGNKSMFIHSIQIMHHSVICQDLKLIIWKYYRKEIIKFLCSIIIRMLFSSFKSHFHCRCCSVMSIRNIYRRDIFKLLTYRLNLLIPVDHPHAMPNFIICNKIIYCCVRCFPLFHQIKQLLWIAARKINRSSIRITHIYMTDTVLLLIFSGKFMFFYDALHIIID